MGHTVRSLSLATTLGLLVLAWPAPAGAATFIVTRFDDPAPGGCDPGDCSLREAVRAANTTLGVGDTIQLAAGIYQLGIAGTGEDAGDDGDLDVTNDPLTILGLGSAATIIDGGGAATGERVFDIFSSLDLSGATVRNSTSSVGFAGLYGEPGSTLTLTDAVVTGHTNTSSTNGEYGSGINSEGTLSLTDVLVFGNAAPDNCCSGIFQYPQSSTGPFLARNVVSVDNTDEDCCSGMFVANDVSVTIDNVEVSRNVSSSDCCTGIFLDGSGPATITNASVSDNVGPACCTGIYSEKDSLVLRNSTISGNSAPEDCCAGIYLDGSDSTLSNVTVSGNTAQHCCAGITQDGTGTTLTLNNVTVTGNTANSDNAGSEDGAGISQLLGNLVVRNSISFGNTVGTGGEGPNCFGSVTSQGFNIFGDLSGCTLSPTIGDQIGVDPLLGPLADNGGPVATHALAKGSPAVNGGNPAAPGSGGTACEATDARGLARNCDVGAYELTFCRKVPVNRIGTEGKDSLAGTSGADGLLGFGGKDRLAGKAGKDGLCGGPGKDTLKGGGGKDRLDGGPGRDLCVGQAGKDKAKACETEKSI